MDKTYKVCVEIGAILEIDVVAGDEEEAENIATHIAAGQVTHLENDQFGDRDRNIYLASDGIVVRESELYVDT